MLRHFPDFTTMKIGRNEPCPCGSSRKYKQCCLAKDEVRAQGDLPWRRMRRLLKEYPDPMLRLIARVYGPEAAEEAWEEFLLWPDEPTPLDQAGNLEQLFTSWFFHGWAPDPADTDIADSAFHDVPPTRAFLDLSRGSVDPMLREYLESCLTEAFSFFEVQHCEPGSGMTVEDLFTGEVRVVREQSASQSMRKGELFFGLLAQAGGMTLLETCGPVVIPPIEKVGLIDYLRKLSRGSKTMTREQVRNSDHELRDYFLELTRRLLLPPMPQLQNTDGEPLLLQRLVFDIDSAHEAFERLRPLNPEAADEGDEALGVERDTEGRVVRAQIAWTRVGNAKHKAMSNTVLAHIEIDGGRMTTNVNSEARAEAFRKLVAETLGTGARYRAAEVQSAEKLFAQANAGPPRSTSGPAPLAGPEIEALMNRIMAEQYKDWPSQKLPALGGKTPLAAVRTRDGRAKVEALVRSIERDGERLTPPLDPAIVRDLRRRLGLDAE